MNLVPSGWRVRPYIFDLDGSQSLHGATGVARYNIDGPVGVSVQGVKESVQNGLAGVSSHGVKEPIKNGLAGTEQTRSVCEGRRGNESNEVRRMDSPGFEPDGKRSLRSRLRDSNPVSTILALS
jgi:hypothetical protein